MSTPLNDLSMHWVNPNLPLFFVVALKLCAWLPLVVLHCLPWKFTSNLHRQNMKKRYGGKHSSYIKFRYIFRSTFCHFAIFPYVTNIKIEGTLLQYHEGKNWTPTFPNKTWCNYIEQYLNLYLPLGWRTMVISKNLNKCSVQKN